MIEFLYSDKELLTKPGLRGKAQMAERDPLLQEREKTHGSFDFQAKVWAKLWDAIPDNARAKLAFNARQWLAMDMMLVKISRIASGDVKHKDHWDDIAGYAKLGSEACE